MLTFDFQDIETIDDAIFDMETPSSGFAIDPDREHIFSIICKNLLILSMDYGDGKIDVSVDPEDIDAYVSANLSDIFIYKQNMKTPVRRADYIRLDVDTPQRRYNDDSSGCKKLMGGNLRRIKNDEAL